MSLASESGRTRVSMSQTRPCVVCQEPESTHGCVVKYIRSRLPSQAPRGGLASQTRACMGTLRPRDHYDRQQEVARQVTLFVRCQTLKTFKSDRSGDSKSVSTFQVMTEVWLTHVKVVLEYQVTDLHVTMRVIPATTYIRICHTTCSAFTKYHTYIYIYILFNAITCPSWTSWSPSRLWLKCNRLLRLGCPWGAVTLSRWGGWRYKNMEYQERP
jgi:hypothetical protein